MPNSFIIVYLPIILLLGLFLSFSCHAYLLLPEAATGFEEANKPG